MRILQERPAAAALGAARRGRCGAAGGPGIDLIFRQAAQAPR